MNTQTFFYYYPQRSYSYYPNYQTIPAPLSASTQSYIYQPNTVLRTVSSLPFQYYPYPVEKIAQQGFEQVYQIENNQNEVAKKAGCKKENLKTEFHKILASFIENDQGKFCDIDFPPNYHSLVEDGLAKKPNWSSFCWLRPEDFMDMTKPVNIIVGKIEPNDIHKGVLDDASLLSTLAALAEHPRRIAKLVNLDFPGKSEEEVENLCQRFGVYCLRVYDMGIPTEVVIDDFFPTIPKENFITAFSRTVENELWSLLIEKAWAKLYRSYANLEWDITRHSLQDFTGAPTKVVYCDEEPVWENILKGEERDWIMTTGTLGGEEDLTKDGLKTAQAFSLLAGYEFENEENEKVKLVKLRDPHGKCAWNGKWSEGSEEYAKIPKKFLENASGQKNGVFFMELNDFVKKFDCVQFCMVNDDYKYSYITQKSHKKESCFFKVQIPKEGIYFFTVMQRNMKKYSVEEQEGFEYSKVTLIVAKKVGEKYTFIKGVFRNNYEVYTWKDEELPLKAGEYVVMVKVDWNRVPDDDFTLSVYGAEKVKIEPNTRPKAFLKQVFMSYANTKCKDSKTIEGCSVKHELTDEGYAFVSIRNGNKDKKVEVNLKFQNLEEDKLKLKGKKDKNSSFELEPMKEEIVLLKRKQYAEDFPFVEVEIKKKDA